MKPSERNRTAARLRQTFSIVGWVVVTSILLSLIYNRIDLVWTTWLDKVPIEITYMLLILAVPAFAYFTYRGSDRFLRQIRADAVVLSQDEIQELPDRHYVITGVSKMVTKRYPHFETADTTATFLKAFKDDLDTACAPAPPPGRGPFDNWQQALRLVRALPKLKAIYVVENSELQFDRYAMVIRHFRDIPVKRIQDPSATAPGEPFTLKARGQRQRPDYESFDYLQAAIGRGLKMIAADAGLDLPDAERQTLIDVTPGHKTTSIVGAIESLNRDLIFVYMNNDGQLTGFDAALRFGK